MDFGIAGRTAIVCASSKGLGKGCALALAEEGVHLVLNARGKEALEATASEIRSKTGVKVTAVAADVSTLEGRAALLKACPTPDIVVNNAGGPPMGDFRDWDRDAWMKALDANMLAPIELMKATIDGMIGRRFGRFVNITSSAVKAPIASLGLSNGARSGLTGFVAGLARQVAKYNVTINNILPGSFDTDRLRSGAETTAQKSGQTTEAVLEEWKQGEATGRFGTPEEFGALCAFLCSIRAAYINGQNLLLDGGTYPGTF